MPDNEPAPEWVTLINPANDLPWECPNNAESLAYYVDEKGFKKAPAKSASSKKESANG